MNDKQAKKLRRLARTLSVGKPERAYIWVRRLSDNRQLYIILQDCYRKTYINLKKAYSKRGFKRPQHSVESVRETGVSA